jgi:regulator of sigma E protease
LQLGTKQAFSIVFDNIKGFGKIFKGEVSASKAVSGPIGIAQVFGGNWDWVNFWRITGLLSMVLAFMNFLTYSCIRWRTCNVFNLRNGIRKKTF